MNSMLLWRVESANSTYSAEALLDVDGALRIHQAGFKLIRISKRSKPVHVLRVLGTSNNQNTGKWVSGT